MDMGEFCIPTEFFFHHQSKSSALYKRGLLLLRRARFVVRRSCHCEPLTRWGEASSGKCL